MKESLLEDLLKLRFAVGFLIEKNNWWNSNFFDDNATDFLAYIFPKSVKQNSNFYLDPIRHSVDAEVGANYYHLFRLPVQVEEKLYKKINLKNEEQLSSPDAALSFLKELSEDLFIEKHTGPINIGSSELIDKDIIQAIAAHYLSAFENDYKVHPYLN